MSYGLKDGTESMCSPCVIGIREINPSRQSTKCFAALQMQDNPHEDSTRYDHAVKMFSIPDA